MYALKVFRNHRAKERHDAEVYTFQALSRHRESSMIGFFSSHCCKDTYSVLLELADFGTLEEFMQEQEEPTSARDILDFWTGLLKILIALFQIHDLAGHADEFQQENQLIG